MIPLNVNLRLGRFCGGKKDRKIKVYDDEGRKKAAFFESKLAGEYG
ncbi:MAG: hypothetical protein LBR83_09285 [Clostridiales bacterium]|jgi:hypothetical protein|nr:hypothetical protein [Clostridiales bacterium]